MLKFFSYIIFKIIYLLNKLFHTIFKRNFTGWLIYFLQSKTYTKINIDQKTILNFFTPNNLIDWRVRTILTKEPDTINWIDNFIIEKGKQLIFWDIGANIGLYSIYAASKHKNKIKVIAFEPSSSNLRILSRNISINNLSDDIIINQIALIDRKNVFLEMREPNFIEGSSLNTFGKNFNFEGKEFFPNQKYKIFGTTLDAMINDNLIQEPDYIKIDVDGIEHLILKGGNDLFFSKSIKSVLIEINENFTLQKESVLKFMKDHNFNFIKKENNPENLSEKFKKTYNYIFKK